MKSLLTVCVILSMNAFAYAGSYFVDQRHKNASDEPCPGRGSEDLPYLTIQAAVNAVNADSSYDFAAGDTIWVKPGIYDQEGSTWSQTQSSVTYSGESRVYLDVKKVRLQATGSVSDTVIVGRKDPSSDTGIGSTAVSGIKVKAAANGTIIRGFTIRDCAAKVPGQDVPGRGAAFCSESTLNLISDCIISNCAGCGVIGKCTAIRCGFFNNYGDNNDRGLVAREANMIYCVMAGNYGVPDKIVSMGQVVNCTIVDNSSQTLSGNNNVNSKAYNNVLVSCGAASSLSQYKAEATANNVTVAGYHVVSPMTGDFMLESDSPAVNGGVACDLAVFSIPDELDPQKDYAGNVVPSSGVIHCGAIQSFSTLRTGRVKFAVGTNAPRFGMLNGRCCLLPSYAAAANYPAVFSYASADNGAYLLDYYSRSGIPSLDGALTLSDVVWPEVDGSMCIFAPADVSALVTVTSVMTSNTAKDLYVDDDADEGGDGTKISPYRTIAAALSACSVAGSRIHVAAGEYRESGLTTAVSVKIIADEGPSATTLDSVGGQCFAATSGAAPLIQGFTVRNSRASSVFKGYNSSCPLCVRDCIIKNCTSTASIFNYVNVERSKIVGCASDRFIFDYGVAKSTIIGGCTATEAISKRTVNMTYFGCTVSGNLSPYAMTASLTAYNSILEGGTAQASQGACNLVWGLVDETGLPDDGFSKGDPMVIDPATGDARLATPSAAIALCDLPTGNGELARAYTQYYSVDIAGNGYDLMSGVADAGCLQKSYVKLAKVTLTVDSEKGGFAVDGLDVGTTVLVGEETRMVTITRNYGSPHCCLGVRVNGILYDFDENDRWTRTLTSDDGALDIRVVDYSTAWYADANVVYEPGKTYDGMTPKRAFKTLREAVENGKLVSGDTIYLAAGMYGDGKMPTDVYDKTTLLGTTYSRVVVPEGVTIEGVGSRDEVVIEGAFDPATKGRGENAVRCVYLMPGSAVRNVTLRNGYTKAGNSNNALGTGGGVYAVRTSPAPVVEDCTIEDCKAYRGAGVECGIIRRTLFRRCVASDQGGASALSERVSDSIFDGNAGSSILHVPSLVENCTFVNSADVTAVYGATAACENYQVRNSVMFGRVNKGTCVYENCAFVGSDSWIGPDDTAYCTSCVFTNAAAVQLQEYVPIKDRCVLIDAGNTALHDDEKDGAFDALGNPRVLNGNRIDIGAAEYDWRVDFARTLGRRVEVPSADPTVELQDGMVVVGNDATLVFRAALRDQGGEVSFRVSGDGIPTVTCAAAEISVKDGVYSFVGRAHESYEVTVSVVGGSAAVSPLDLPKNGILIMVR